MERELKLNKQVRSNKFINNSKNVGFTELTKSSIPVDEESFLKKYYNIFYRIPVGGKESHRYLIDSAYEYVRTNYLKMLDNKILETTNTLSEKENELALLETPSINNPPDQIYEDGAYLIAGENGAKYPDMHTVYIMQEG